MAKVAKRRGRYVLDYYDDKGKRRWRTLRKGTTLKQAKSELRDIEDQLEKGVYISVREVPLFRKVASDWLEYKKANVRGSTWEMYRGHVKKHFEQINDSKINKITVFLADKELEI